eukprot:2177414-Rhodomonas_salina.1
MSITPSPFSSESTNLPPRSPLSPRVAAHEAASRGEGSGPLHHGVVEVSVSLEGHADDLCEHLVQ